MPRRRSHRRKTPLCAHPMTQASTGCHRQCRRQTPSEKTNHSFAKTTVSHISKFQMERLGDSVLLSDLKSRYGQLTSLEERCRKLAPNITFTSGFQLGISSQDKLDGLHVQFEFHGSKTLVKQKNMLLELLPFSQANMEYNFCPFQSIPQVSRGTWHP